MSDQHRSIWAKVGAGFEFFGLLVELFAILAKLCLLLVILLALGWCSWVVLAH